MADPFVGEIRMFAGNFAPRGWALCNGQLLAISQNDALFSLFGTTYGGDGRTTFGLPDFRGRIPIHQGTGPGLSPRRIGDKSGTETETLTITKFPAHLHSFQVSTDLANETEPGDNVLAESTVANMYYRTDPLDPTDALANSAVSEVGGGQSHPNMMPFLCINFIVALFGIYPSRN